MTKKDYELVAACIGAESAHTDSSKSKKTLGSIAMRLTTEFSLDNPRFDEAKFWSRVEYWRKNHGGE